MAAQSRNIYFPLQSQDPSPYSTQSCMKWDFFQAVWREQALFLTLHMQQWLLPLNFRRVLLSIRCPHTYILINIQLNAQGEGFIDFWSHMSVHLPLVQHSLLWRRHRAWGEWSSGYWEQISQTLLQIFIHLLLGRRWGTFLTFMEPYENTNIPGKIHV